MELGSHWEAQLAALSSLRDWLALLVLRVGRKAGLEERTSSSKQA